MEQGWYQRLVVVLVLVAAAIYYALPSFIYFTAPPEVRSSTEKLAEVTPEWLPDAKFNLGIDLQGGLHLVMGVDAEKAVQDHTDRLAADIYEMVEEKGVLLTRARREGEAPEITFELNSSEDWQTLKPILDDWRGSWAVLSRSSSLVVFGMSADRQNEIRTDALDQALKTIRNRIDQTGTKEPDIRKRGDGSILIQLAGVSKEDQDRVRDEVIGRTAQLEFKIVDETNQYFAEIAQAENKPASVTLQVDRAGSELRNASNRPFLIGTDKEELRNFLAAHQDTLPPDLEVGVEEYQLNPQATPEYRSYLLDRRPGITGEFLENAFPSFNPEESTYEVTMRFDRKGAVIFEKLTRENIGRQMAIVLDGVVDSAPVIQSAIPGGNARISSRGTQQEALLAAKSLSLVLKAGALPAPVYVQEERTVGPTLGDDAVAKGKTALMVALTGVLIIMLVYYRGSGLMGIIALSCNLLLLFAALALGGVTLTLPGIAGLALTIGMAVDANIIQFERIREELRSGKAPQTAVDAGFDKALSAIFDANVTTLLACIVLGSFGSGPIRGFAVTLGIGVVINTFTAVVVPRLGLDYFARGRRVKSLSI
ncbi:MAG: protein translocase subunit SecD [Myxococcales bacterium]|nr:protein translocase subunit SecD [Myxococcales bacterium]